MLLINLFGGVISEAYEIGPLLQTNPDAALGTKKKKNGQFSFSSLILAEVFISFPLTLHPWGNTWLLAAIRFPTFNLEREI